MAPVYFPCIWGSVRSNLRVPCIYIYIYIYIFIWGSVRSKLRVMLPFVRVGNCGLKFAV